VDYAGVVTFNGTAGIPLLKSRASELRNSDPNYGSVDIRSASIPMTVCFLTRTRDCPFLSVLRSGCSRTYARFYKCP
jgi:hypothetical protein